jgi:hypothetical protein
MLASPLTAIAMTLPAVAIAKQREQVLDERAPRSSHALARVQGIDV